jgi:hypothetical protein
MDTEFVAAARRQSAAARESTTCLLDAAARALDRAEVDNRRHHDDLVRNGQALIARSSSGARPDQETLSFDVEDDEHYSRSWLR